MIQARYLADIKLFLDILARFDIYPEMVELENFLAESQHLALLYDFAEEVKAAWEKNSAHSQQSRPADSEEKLPLPVEVAATAFTELAVSQDLSVQIPPKLSESPTLFDNESAPGVEILKLEAQLPQKPSRFKLANATVGKSYQAQLEWTGQQAIAVVQVYGLAELGLNYEAETRLVSGEPANAGEYRLTVDYQPLEDAEQTVITAELNLVINSDPKSLWKNIPSDTKVPFWKPDSECQGISGLMEWKLAAASKRGRSHAHVGSCRDDDFALSVDKESGWQILAVADGAGSSEFSREGARIIAHHGSEILQLQLQQVAEQLHPLIAHWQTEKSPEDGAVLQQLLATVFTTALQSTVEKIEQLAKQQQVAYRDFYSTLLLAAHKTFPDGEFVVGYWVGDGGLALYRAGENIELLGDGDSGEYAGQTRFLDRNALNDEDILKRLRFTSQPDFTALFLMTDGITDPLFETDHNLRGVYYWDMLWQKIQPLLLETPELNAQALLEWLDFWSPGNHDDRTIALIYR